jgi:formate/nitrite transporter FocA (FNT family)
MRSEKYRRTFQTDDKFKYTTVAALQGRLSVPKLALHWFICFWGNLAGSLFVAIIIVGCKFVNLLLSLGQMFLVFSADHGCDLDGGIFSASPYKDEAIAYAIKKQVTPEWHQVFLRGIGCNWLVCLAAMLALQAKDLASKVVAMWFPIFGFVALGFDHVVANMFFVPIGIFLGAPGVSVGLYVWKGT